MIDLSALWLDPVPAGLHQQAVAAIERGDARAFLFLSSNEYSIALVGNNAEVLWERGIYEKALLYALTATRTNHHHVPRWHLESLIKMADKGKLLAAGDPLPDKRPLTLYRGVAGNGAYRRIRGISWTANFDRAVWFAERFRLPDPAVYKVVLAAEHVLARVTERNEDEYIVLLPKWTRVVRIDWRSKVTQGTPN